MEVIYISKPKIRIEDNGPYQLTGDFTLLDDLGDSYETKGTISLCRCGHSDEKPFCDGTHEEIDFRSEPRSHDLMVEV